MFNNNSPRTSREALRTLVLVLVTVIAFMIYSYGWEVTDINLSTPQQETRQTNVGNALRELLSPRIFEQDREVFDYGENFVIGCDYDSADQQQVDDGGPFILVEPRCGVPGDLITIEGRNLSPSAAARIRWVPVEGQARPREDITSGREELIVSRDGAFSAIIEVPRISGSEGQTHVVQLRVAVPDGPVRFSDTTNEVIRRMVETIFMALLATSIAIPIAFVLSFLAAHNLMKPVRLTLGSMLVSFIALPVGWWLGATLLGDLGRFGVEVGRGDIALALGGFLIPVAAVVLGGLAIRWMSARLVFPVGSWQAEAVGIARQIVVIVLLIFVAGAIGGLGILGGDQFRSLGDTIRPEGDGNALLWLQRALADGIGGVGQLIGILGEMVELFIGGVAGLVGAFTLSGILTSTTRKPLLHLPYRPSVVVGGVLGAISGGLLLAGVAEIGRGAALLGLLVPFTTALLGGQIMVMILRRVFHIRRRAGGSRTNTDVFASALLFIVSAVVIFILTFDVLQIGRAIIDGTLPPDTTIDLLAFDMSLYVFDAVLFGAVLGGIAGALATSNATFPVGTVLYNVARTLMNTTRSIEPLIMGLVFVIWVGIGPFAGVMALTLHSIASLGKLYSEQIENIDEGPIEALLATGANRLQTIVYAVVPQIIPPYIAFTMYRWDINVRMSTIIGFVGGGGIGLLLNQQINLLRYRDAGVAVLAIAIVVSILDYASASIREQLTR